MHSKKKILLINPKYDGSSPEFPLGLGYVAAALENDGYEVATIDLNIHSQEKLQSMLHGEYLFIGITGLTFAFKNIEKLVRDIKETNMFFSPIVLGGIIVSSYPEFMVSHFSDIEYFINGEGEETIVELAHALEKGISDLNLNNIKGLIYRDKQGIVVNQKRPLIKNINDIIFPARHLFDFEVYIKRSNPQFARVANIIGSRGCFAKCTFCFRNFDGQYRIRSINNVIDEIEMLIKNYNIEHVDFRDELFLATDSRIIAFCMEVKKRKLRFTWAAALRLESVRKKSTYKIMRETGCISLTTGTESASKKMIEVIKKGTTHELIKSSLSMMKNSGINVATSFILGMPGEDKNTIRETEEVIGPLKFPAGTVYLPRAFPGTWLYQYSLEKGYIKDEIKYLRGICNGNVSDLTINYTEFEDDYLLSEQKRLIQELFNPPKNYFESIGWHWQTLKIIIRIRRLSIIVKFSLFLLNTFLLQKALSVVKSRVEKLLGRKKDARAVV